MDNFIFNVPTILYFSMGQIGIPGETIKVHGGSKVLPASGGSSKKKRHLR